MSKTAIEMAREVGATVEVGMAPVFYTHSELLKFAELVRADERAKLAEQEPAAWANPNDMLKFDMQVRTHGGPLHTVPLYTTPQRCSTAREPLTDEQLRSMCKQTWVFETVKQWARVIEAAHGIKETT